MYNIGLQRVEVTGSTQVLIQTHNAVSVPPSGNIPSTIIDCRGMDSIAVGTKNDAATSRTVNVEWYAEQAAINGLGSEAVVATGSFFTGIGRITVKAPWAKVTLVNGDVGAHTMSSWTTLIP